MIRGVIRVFVGYLLFIHAPVIGIMFTIFNIIIGETSNA